MPAGGLWRTPVTVSAPGLAGEPHVAFDGQGDAVAVWDIWSHGFLSPRIVQAAVMSPGGAWQSPVNIVGAADELDQPKEAGDPGIAVDAQGDAVAVWAWAFGNPVIQTAFKPAGGAWQAPVNISGEGASSPQVAFDGQGNALAVWDGEDGAVQAAFKPTGGAWQAPVDIGHGGGPQVAFDGQGDAVAVWAGERGIEGAGYAAAGPHLNGLSIPATGIVGQPLTFSVAPLDVWSVLGETIWSFGDGAFSGGTSVTHTYTAAGTYEVTLHSADVLGNTTSASGMVTITSASATPAAPTPTPAALTPKLVVPTIAAADQSASILRYVGKRPVGITFYVALNEQATVSFSFVQRSIGRMVGDKCVAKTSRNAGHEACKRGAVAGVLTFAGHSGANRVVFEGRIPHSKKLKPGRYTLVITATNAAGQHSSHKSLSFTIVGPVATHKARFG